MTAAPDVLETPRRRARTTTPAAPPEIADVQRPLDARLFWCGTLSDCPRHNLALGGIPFVATSDLVQDLRGETRRVPRNGGLYWLTPAQVERVKAAIVDRVVRQITRGRPSSGPLDPGVPATYGIYTRQGNASAPYAALTGDEPLGRYIYLIDVEAQAKILGPLWRDGEPPPYQG